jgi:hypothetical protein
MTVYERDVSEAHPKADLIRTSKATDWSSLLFRMD